MPTLDSLSDRPNDWTDQEELALAILEGLTAEDWQAVAELARLHTSGGLSFSAWRSAVQALLQRCARCAD